MSFLRRFYHRPRQLLARRANFQVHVWLGVAVSVYMIVIGISGSILVFRDEIERLGGRNPWHGAPRADRWADARVVVSNLNSAYPRARVK